MGAVLIFRDISRARAREAELLQLKRMIDLSHDAIIVTDSERRVTSWNRGAQEIYGWEAAEARGKVLDVLLRTETSAKEEKEKSLGQNSSWEGELVHLCKNEREIRCESRQVLLRDADGNIQGLLEINRDITERKRIEEKLRESAKLESLGVLAGGIAHDFNNLLTGVMGNASLLLDEVPAGSPAWSFAEGISQAAERAAKLAHQMLAYSGRGRFVIERVELSEYVRQTTALIQSSMPKNVELILDLAQDLPLIEADASQLQQLVMNLVINAAEAIGPERGRVTVATRSHMVDDAYRRTLLLEEHLKPGRYAVLEISDTGCGMSEQTLSRIFDPFFTTKFVGRGLGLAAVQGIVRGHKGGMKIYSRVGEGTTFRVLLPAIAAAAAFETERPSELEGLETGAGTVLVIDDEEIIRSTATSALRRLGYAVLTASDGSQGLETFRSHNESIRLVLLDLSMPGISGEETMLELRKIRSDVPILLSSGFSEAEALRRFGNSGLAGFLQKPYTVKGLAMQVRAAIGRAASGAAD